MEMNLNFPGGVAVEAVWKGHTIRTDQPAPHGGDSAPAPFDLFLASIATCAGFYALRFCQERQLPTEGLALSMDFDKNPETKMISTIRIRLTPPKDFPEKYNAAIVRAMDTCAVKRHILDAPAFEVGLASEPAPFAG
jgi:ribosomal protein S12 methylthiotransferase accessory factor